MAGFTLGTGGIVQPNAQKMTTAGSYIDFRSTTTAGWAQQYLPELYEAEVEKYGDRSISGFIQMLGAEMPMASDQVIWSEQGRLHLAYEGAAVVDGGQITIAGGGTHAVRVGQTIVLSDNQASPTIIKCYVSAVAADNTTLDVLPYAGAVSYTHLRAHET